MYLITKSTPRNEWRVYIDDNETKPGEILYKGHRLGVPTPILEEIMEFRMELSKNRIFLLKYEKMEDGALADVRNLQIWRPVRQDHLEKELLDEWIQINRNLKEKFGSFTKIVISKINI